ncbi:MAG: VanZ family protein [Treponema sp.]|nr:VanZ family protein [Treponema sp.]
MLIKILKWIPALFIACSSFYLSSQERIEMMPEFWNADKLVHFICYGGFSFWVAFACNIKNFKMTLIPTIIVSVWGISDEIHQSFVPGRSVSVLDWLADTCGAFLGAVIYLLIARKIIPALLLKFKKN